MKKLLMLMFLAVCVISSVQAFGPANKKDFVGEWKFESQYAPESYQTGIFFIEEKEGELAGEVRFPDGYKVKMDSMKVTDGVLKFTINVEYTPVNMKATIEDNVLKGAAESPEGDIPFTAKRVKKENQ